MEICLQYLLTDSPVCGSHKATVILTDICFIKSSAIISSPGSLVRKQKTEIKPYKRIADLIGSGQYFFHQLQFHQILQIDTDLRPGESGTGIHSIQLAVLLICYGGKDGIVDSSLPQFFRQPFDHQFRKKTVFF